MTNHAASATDASFDGAAGDRSEQTRLSLYRRMFEIRQFELRVSDLFMKGLVNASTHLSIGQEAISAAFGEAMQPTDYTFATYRGHAHTLSRGVPMTAVMAELMGKASGLMAGKGGSMHLTSVEHGAMGSYAIVGAHLPIACGAAWSAQYRHSSQVTVCFFGDGTTNIGAFHEALNLASVWKLPVVFVCENNQYMEYTAIGSVTAVSRPAADRASAYGLDPQVVDGNNADAMYDAAVAALERARSCDGPSLLEALTYRHGGHSRGDDGKYRPNDELLDWLARDPITSHRNRLIAAGVSEKTLDEIEFDAKNEVDAATDSASSAPLPDPELLMTEVWADGGSSWRN